MINKYYYLVASLPRLEFGNPSPITREGFLFECRKWLAPSDFDRLARIDINDFGRNPKDPLIIEEWKTFDSALREGLAGARRARKDSTRMKPPELFREVFEESNPLLMEKRLLKIKWDFIEEEEFGYHFDINNLTLYFLRLQILERLAVFEHEKGKAAFEELCEVAYESR